MNVKLIITFMLLCLLGNSCKNNTNKHDSKDSAIENQKIKNISELNFQEILFLLYNENEFGVDYHGESFGQEAIEVITLKKSSKTNCGDEIILINSSKEKQVQAAVMTTFNFPNNPVNEIAMVYKIRPGDSLPAGRNVFCYNGEKFIITRKVLSAGFVTDD